jgi:hypothetical protein
MHEASDVRISAAAFHQQMNVVRHEAMGGNFHALSFGSTQNLTPDQGDRIRVDEERRASARAEREKNAVETRVVERPKAWPSLEHDGTTMAKSEPWSRPEGLRYD